MNNYNNVDDLIAIHDLLIKNLQIFSSSFKIQKEKYKHAVLSDELASDFSDIDIERMKILFENGWITEEQLNLGEKINAFLEEMNKDKSLWTDEAVKKSLEWEKCREMGLELLESLGY
ncbi:hypothetical protein [Enterococcus phoeniculicola]|uniref:Uncharacterized protein n=1 Tax=Enterococcus phoeniculicola ATCC BAA-412 TaxID=1158610 RepID=R3WMI5_9ENTE|nr:hypothetical protein [Enterococcus phoeniculicola]EOL43045.1 hypothetical protein UC3_02022 [Enterococcus phoeniculicola ATCC BAA-412]EOT76597.1 hypothetical protein I589_01554 [Enterococcus phoeniculicola ATCC BAA-412]